MLTHRIFEDQTANATSESVSPMNVGRIEYGIFQISFGGGSGSVVLQGRVHPDMAWVDILTFTTDDAQRVTLFPFMQAVASGLTAANVNAYLAE